MSNQHEIRAAMNRIKTALCQHGYDELIGNLAGGASTEELQTFERMIGFILPMALRELWSIHAGQKTENGYPIRDDEGNGFFGEVDFLGPKDAQDCHALIEPTLDVIKEARSHEAEIAGMLERGEDIGRWRADFSDWSESGMSNEEVDSDEWICFAGNGEYSCWLAVNAKTGRVFEYLKMHFTFKLAAGSIADWLNRHAAGVEKYRDPAGR